MKILLFILIFVYVNADNNNSFVDEDEIQEIILDNVSPFLYREILQENEINKKKLKSLKEVTRDKQIIDECTYDNSEDDLNCEINITSSNTYESNDHLKEIFKFLDNNEQALIYDLKDAISIASVSNDPDRRSETIKIVNWMRDKLVSLNVSVIMDDNGFQVINEEKIPLPPILFGVLNSDANITILIYGHLDVVNAKKDDWNTDPWNLTEINGNLYGRGTTDDKGPVAGWIYVVKAYQKVYRKLPVNIKFLFEAMEETLSIGLESFIKRRRDLFEDIDYVIVSDSPFIHKKPCLTYGLRGISSFSLTISGPNVDLHSGQFGGSVIEPMNDLIYLLNSLVDSEQVLKIPGIYDEVLPVTVKEILLYCDINFSSACSAKSLGLSRLIYPTKIETLMHRWRFPSLSFHGIEGAYSGPGVKTVIPNQVTGKFSIRLVPNMKVETVNNLVSEYLEEKFKVRNSPNKIKLIKHGGIEAWLTDPFHKSFEAAKRATREVYGFDPDFTRVGGTIPIVLLLQREIKKPIVLVPIGFGDDGAHSVNEKINKNGLLKGIKVLAAYIYYVNQL